MSDTAVRCGRCGHWESEHDPSAGMRQRRCHGRYATVTADADGAESVAVSCHCLIFYEALPDQFEVWSCPELRWREGA